MELKFGLATLSNLWSLDWDERRAVVGDIVDPGLITFLWLIMSPSEIDRD